MSAIKFIPKDPIKPLFAIKVSPTLHKILETIVEESKRVSLTKEVLGINPKRVVGLKNILDENKNNGTMVIIYNYIYKRIAPKYDIPCDNKGIFQFKIYDVDFNRDINIEDLLK